MRECGENGATAAQHHSYIRPRSKLRSMFNVILIGQFNPWDFLQESVPSLVCSLPIARFALLYSCDFLCSHISSGLVVVRFSQESKTKPESK